MEFFPFSPLKEVKKGNMSLKEESGTSGYIFVSIKLQGD